ncbi:MAG TPA: 2Fe-2S iron-sulfur cluster-binding protein [Sphingobium sp.]
MALVTYIEHDGREYKVDVASGDTVMQGALNNMVEGIVAECGGGLACATCHCYVDDSWIDRVGEAEGVEKEMLEAASAEVKPTSRLSCQLTISDELDGLIVHLPESQY